MTEEDQIMVAKAVLAGVRLWQTVDGYWRRSTNPGPGMFSIGRAAACALVELGLITVEEHHAYDRPCCLTGPVDVNCDGW